MKKSSPNNPLVSVVMPCFNYGRYLADAIDSVQSQTYHNIELWVIDDGSTDNTQQVVADHASSNLSYYYQENKGAAEARNVGISKARGEFLMFLDADDILMPNAIDKLVRVLNVNPGMSYVYPDMEVFGRKEQRVANIQPFSLDELKKKNIIHIGALFRSEIIKEFKFDSSFSAYEDWDLYLSLAENGFVGKFVPDKLLHYRKHDKLDSLSDKVLSRREQILLNYKIFRKHKNLYAPRHAIKFLIGSYKNMLFGKP